MKPLENEVSVNIDQTYGQSLGIELIEKTDFYNGPKRFLIEKILTGGLASGRTDIKTGDEVLAVNDSRLTDTTLNEATNLLNDQNYSMICLRIKPENLSSKNDASPNNGSGIDCSSSDLLDDPDDDSDPGFFPPLPLSFPPPLRVQDGGEDGDLLPPPAIHDVGEDVDPLPPPATFDGSEDVEPLPPPPSLSFNSNISGIVLPADNGCGGEEGDDNDDFPLPPPLEMLSPKTPTIKTSPPSLKTDYNAFSDESYENQSEIKTEMSSTCDPVTSASTNLSTNYFNFLSSSSKGFSSFASRLNASAGSSINDNGVTEKGAETSTEENFQNCDSEKNVSEFNNSLIIDSNLVTENDNIFIDYKDSEIFTPVEVVSTPTDIDLRVCEVFNNEEKSTLDNFEENQLPTPFFEESPNKITDINEPNSNVIRDSFSVAKEILTKNETVSSVLKDYYVDVPKVDSDLSESKQEQHTKAKKPIMAQALLPKNMRGITDLQSTVLGSGGIGLNPALGELQDLVNTEKIEKEELSLPEIWAGVKKSRNKITDTPNIGYKKNEDAVDQSNLLLQQNEIFKTEVHEKQATFKTSKSESWNMSEESVANTDLLKSAKKATPPVREKTFAKIPKVVGFSENQIKNLIEMQKGKAVQHKHSNSGSNRSVSRSSASVSDKDNDPNDNKCSVSHLEGQLDADVFKEESKLINKDDGCKNEEKEFVDIKKKIQDSRKLFEAMSLNKIEDKLQDSGLSRSKSAVSSLTKQPQFKNIRGKLVMNQDPKNLDVSKDIPEEKHHRDVRVLKNEAVNDFVPMKSSSVGGSDDVSVESIQPISEKKAFYELMNKAKGETPKPLPKKAFSFSVKSSSDEGDSNPKISSYRNKLKSTGRLIDLTKTNVLHSKAGADDGENIVTNVEENIAEKGAAGGNNTNKPMMPVDALKSKFETPTKKMPSSSSAISRSVDESNSYAPPTQGDSKRPGKSIASLISDSPKSSVWKSFLQNYSQK